MTSASASEHEDLLRSFAHILPGLPAIDGFRIETIPLGKTEAEMLRFEAGEVDEPYEYVRAEEQIGAPGREIAEYRFRLDRSRRKVVRERVVEVVSEIDSWWVAWAG